MSRDPLRIYGSWGMLYYKILWNQNGFMAFYRLIHYPGEFHGATMDSWHFWRERHPSPKLPWIHDGSIVVRQILKSTHRNDGPKWTHGPLRRILSYSQILRIHAVPWHLRVELYARLNTMNPLWIHCICEYVTPCAQIRGNLCGFTGFYGGIVPSSWMRRTRRDSMAVWEISHYPVEYHEFVPDSWYSTK